MTWRITVDSGRCIGSGACTGVAPDAFQLDGERSRPVRSAIAPDDRIRDAAETCPVEAIAVYDAGTGERIAPG